MATFGESVPLIYGPAKLFLGVPRV